MQSVYDEQMIAAQKSHTLKRHILSVSFIVKKEAQTHFTNKQNIWQTYNRWFEMLKQ